MSSEEKFERNGCLFRVAHEADIPALVDTHAAVFPETVMAKLGRGYLTAYYQRVRKFDDGIVVIAERDGKLVGFASGFIRPERFYRNMIGNAWSLIVPLITGLIRRPGLLQLVPYSVGRVFRSTPTPPTVSSCELAFIAVQPQAAGKGVGKELANQFLRTSWEKGAEFVRLTTHAESNEATNNFYASLGFRVQRTFRQCRGCLTNEYVYSRRHSHPQDFNTQANF